jgi:hypothetical protein
MDEDQSLGAKAKKHLIIGTPRTTKYGHLSHLSDLTGFYVILGSSKF